MIDPDFEKYLISLWYGLIMICTGYLIILAALIFTISIIKIW